VRADICQPGQSRPIADVIKFLGEHASPPLLMVNVEIKLKPRIERFPERFRVLSGSIEIQGEVESRRYC
jgi:hypothetical protein